MVELNVEIIDGIALGAVGDTMFSDTVLILEIFSVLGGATTFSFKFSSNDNSLFCNFIGEDGSALGTCSNKFGTDGSFLGMCSSKFGTDNAGFGAVIMGLDGGKSATLGATDATEGCVPIVPFVIPC